MMDAIGSWPLIIQLIWTGAPSSLSRPLSHPEAVTMMRYHIPVTYTKVV